MKDFKLYCIVFLSVLVILSPINADNHYGNRGNGGWYFSRWKRQGLRQQRWKWRCRNRCFRRRPRVFQCWKWGRRNRCHRWKCRIYLRTRKRKQCPEIKYVRNTKIYEGEFLGQCSTGCDYKIPLIRGQVHLQMVALNSLF